MFKMPPKPAKNKVRNKTATKVSAKDRVKEYSNTNLHESDGFLFCTPCNVQLDHIRKSVIDNHLKSHKHVEKKRKLDESTSAENAEKKLKRQETIHGMFKRQTDTSQATNLIHFEIVEAFASANIPLNKL